MNRNNKRVLNEEQVKDIILQVAEGLRKYPFESAEVLMSYYLQGDIQGMFDIVSDWIEIAEDEVLDQLNHDLNEDAFDNHSAHYEL